MALAPVAVAAAVLLGRQRDGRIVVDVSKFGARGDGVTDDSQAIQAAVGFLRSKDTLYFPPGIYRFAQRHPTGAAAIAITGVSDVEIEFASGAELFMDNLDPTAHTGTSHGLLVRGPASRISLRNVSIRWAAGAKRSLGDGIRVVGCPDDGDSPPVGWSGPRAPVAGINLADCVVRGSPQAGVVMFGVSGIDVAGLRVANSQADGLHFNACRRARIDDYSAVDTGDDGMALVTYFARRFSFDDAAHTFSFPVLTDWSNADFAISNVSIVGGKANGVRIAGAHRVTLTDLRVAGVQSGSAVMVDSAEPGSDVGWNYVASRAVRAEGVTAADCDTGVHLLARPGASGDVRFSDFDVSLDDTKFDGCHNWSVRAESLTDHKVSGLRIRNCAISSASTAGGNGGVGIANANGISLRNVSIRHAERVVALSAVNTGQLAVERLSVTIGKSDQQAVSAPPCLSLNGSDRVITDVTFLEITPALGDAAINCR
ncbi:glycosyl hydrolase family 28-related protein [Mycolicibacterium stellerae]|uniref:glycosyl hydrolase family 28-related protein n=1 Tax=Mycolicibacterium stellerae TaxID=2358193 RepID=UPI001F2DF656|nr:glycosyl hydrolase family 28-related protein [Mycolicibacterium stellerae]